MNQSTTNPTTDKLFEVILKLENLDESRRFFRDLLTKPELAEFANRWRVARMLDDGVTYSEIERITGMSSTTIARVSRWLNRGKGGYRLMLRKLNKETEAPKKSKRYSSSLSRSEIKDLIPASQQARTINTHHHHQAQTLESG